MRLQQIVTLVLIVLMYVAWIYIEQNYLKSYLIDLSIQHIKIFRGIAAKVKHLDLFFSLVSQAGDKYGIIACIWISIHFQNSAHAFIVGVLSAVCLVISQTVKSFLRDARPFMINDEISVKDCKHVEFGNPSSHTFLSSAMFMTTAWLFYKELTHRFKIKQSVIHMIIIMNAIFILIFIIGFSRVFKGVHSYNQIASGLVQGLLIAMLPTFVFYEDLFRFYMSLRNKSAFGVLFNGFTVSYIALILVACMVHWDTQREFTVPQEWMKNLGKQCPHLNLDAIDFEAYNFKKISNSFHIIGSYFGVVFDWKMSPARKLVHFNRTDLLVSLIRFGVCAVPLVPLLIMQKLSAKILPDVFKNAPMMHFFPVVQGFFLFGFTKIIAQKLQLVNDELPAGETPDGDDAELISIMTSQEITPEAKGKQKVYKKGSKKE